MPFTLIKGQFRVVGLSPDGDSIRFLADDPALLNGLPGGRPDPHPKPFAQLRLEGIDALETHYAARHQPTHWARAARDRLLEFAGIRNVQWDANQATIVAADDGTRGWILSREREKYGRPVAFLFAGDPPDADGSQIVLRPPMLRQSFNYTALAEGLAYPTYYTGLFSDLRQEFTTAVSAARSQGLGLWPGDRSTAGFDATSLAVIIDQVAILPKLFRRLSDYMAANGSAVGFREALALGGDVVWDLREQNRTHFDTFVQQAPGSVNIQLTRNPEELVFDPMPDVPGNFFAAMIGAPISGDAMQVAA
ncbi:nuclease [Bradyrhizobium guangdongense]|uniref:thermonuclease family protein n=1 Tax=Bradyrhizobium guangdongense TaxID=1325090 RepID=UPI0016436397|nr:thermonuclease family protein [Bradyrhizobium guangdongense]TPQ28202.1 nuclease [Bradyrhizobium guangdongense]